MAAHPVDSLRLPPACGTCASDPPYGDAPAEQLPVAGGTVQIAVVYLTPNSTKEPITLRLDREVLDYFRRSGSG